MNWIKLSGLAMVAALIAAPATVVTAAPAYADDCGDPGQPPCTGPVPTVDQVVAIMAELTDANKPARGGQDRHRHPRIHPRGSRDYRRSSEPDA